jgi:hypothetical protein
MARPQLLREAGMSNRLHGRPSGRIRVPDWPERLAEFVEERRNVPFVWGVHDCAMFAADAVLLQTREDPLRAWRGAYHTEEAGHLITAPAGGFVAFMGAAFRAFGAPVCPTVMAQRGDVGIASYGNTESLALVLGETVAVPGPDRLSFLPVRHLTAAWAI